LRAGAGVHVVLLAEESQLCLDSLVAIQEGLPGVTVSCVLLNAVAPLAAASAAAAHLGARHCDALISHEFWSPLLHVYTERLLWPAAARRQPALVTNFMGGLLWSYSWDAGHVRTIADWMQDYLERAGAFASDFLVFSNTYHMSFHSERWTLRGQQIVGPNIVPDSLLSRATAFRMQAYPVAGVAFVARVDKRKGIAELLAALLQLADMPRIRLEVIGSLGEVDGKPAREYIERTLEDASHIDYVVHGPMAPAAVWRYVKERELLLVSPSLLENAPTTINLAAAHLIPTLFYDTGGVAEMVTPQSAARCVLPPDVAVLTARVRECLTARVGYAPVLQDVMYQAKPRWLALGKRALRLRRPRPAVRLQSAPPPTYLPLLLHKRSTCALVASKLAYVRASVVLLHHAKYEPLNTTMVAATLYALAENDHVAGFVGQIDAPDGRQLTPAGPFFFPSRDWSVCGPEAPLFVRIELLRRYLEVHGGQPFRQWIFTAWLIYQERQMVLQVPHPLFCFTGCFDMADCFSAEFPFASPRLAVNTENFQKLYYQPNMLVTTKELPFADFLRETCGAKGDEHWLAAAFEPKFCSGTTEHGAFTLTALKASLSYHPFCGAQCVPHPAV
jgi:glycosyltransferase involved in cell wall biosynthesis